MPSSLPEFHSSRLDGCEELQARGPFLARHASGDRINAEAVLTIDEPLKLPGIVVEGEGRSRRDAITCYLSGGEGWREAAKLLRGTFVDGTAELKGA